MEEFIEQYCNKHPSEQIFQFRFNKDVNQVMSCITCLEEQNELSGICNIILQSFLNTEDQTLFANCLAEFNLQKSKQNIQEILPKKDRQAEIESLFNALKDQIIQKINEIQKSYLQMIVDKDTMDEEILNGYNQISIKQKIKEILKDNQSSVEIKNQKLKLIAHEFLNSPHQNSEKIINIIDDNEQKQKSIILNIVELQKSLYQTLDDHLIQLQKQNFDLLESNQILSENINTKFEIPSFYFIGSDYYDSQQRSSINQNTLIAKVDFSYPCQIQSYSNIILEPNKQYEILIELIQNENRQKLFFGFGLIQEDKIHVNYYEQKLMYHSNTNCLGISQIKKGESLSNFEISKKINQFMLKICIKDNTLEVSDFPNQENIIAYDSNQNIDKSKKYRFCLNLPTNYQIGDWIKATLLSVINKQN